MSYVLPPSISKISIGSATETIASGTVSITITVRNAASFSGSSYTMDLIDVGSIELDFNYIESIGDIDDFTVNLPRMEFKILDSIKLASGTTRESFVDLISSLSGDDIMIIKMTVNSGSDYYYATRDNCEFSFSSRSVKISALHPIKFGLLPVDSEWGTSYFSGKTVPYLFGATNINVVLPKDLIEGYLKQLGDTPVIEYHSSLYTKTYTDTFTSNEKALLPADFPAGSTTFDPAPDDFEDATIRVKQYALGECAIVGNVFGYGFYVPRFDKTGSNEVAITSDNLESLEMNIKFKNVRYYDFVVDHTPSLSVDTNNEIINPLGDIDASIYYTRPDYQFSAAWSTLNNRFEFSTFTYPAGFADNLEIAFKKVFRVSDSLNSIDAGVYISGTIFGIDTLKPYQYFSIASGVHPLVNGKDFRPAYLKYNLKDDTIEFEAYEF